MESKSEPAVQDEVVFFCDWNMGRRHVPDALRNAGFRVETLHEYFESVESDDKWLVEAGREQWVVLTKDEQIGRKSNEIEALRNAKVAAFVLAAKDLRGEEMAATMLAALPRVLKFLFETPRPFIAKIYRDGSVVPWR